MDVVLLNRSRWFPLSKLEMIYLPPNMQLTHKTRWAQLQKKTEILVAKVFVVKVTENSAVSQRLLRHSSNGDWCWYAESNVYLFFALNLGLSVFPLSLRLLLKSLPVPLFANGDFFPVVVVGVYDDDMFAESIKKEQKNKRKTQKLGWLWVPDRSCERKAEDRHRGFSSGFSFRLPIASSYKTGSRS